MHNVSGKQTPTNPVHAGRQLLEGVKEQVYSWASRTTLPPERIQRGEVHTLCMYIMHNPTRQSVAVQCDGASQLNKQYPS